jgi:peroxiredoxin
MNRFFLSAATILCSIVSRPVFAVKEGDVLPKIQVLDASGKAVEPWAGKKTLINFWATWCDACKVELKEMRGEIAKVGADRQVLFVSLDKDSDKAKSWMTDQFKDSPEMTKSLYFDPSFKLADNLGVESFPMTLIVDERGKVLKIQEGFKEGSGSTAALFGELKK